MAASSAARDSEATRYLCAAMHRDRRLCDKFLGELRYNEYNSLGVSPGVDLAVVARHALAADARRQRRDWALCVVLVVAAIAALAGAFALLPTCLFAAWAIVAGERFAARMFVARNLLTGTYRPEVKLGKLPYTWSQRLSELERAQDGNVSVYSGFSPFVGCGSIIGGWSFAINLQRGANGNGPEAIAVSELHECVAAKLGEIGFPGLTLEDRLLIDGKGIRSNRRFLPSATSRPVPSVSPDLVAQVRDHPERAVRHNQCIRIVDWDGELVLSIFLNFTRLSHMLYAEATYLVLPPLAGKFRAIDDLAPRPRAEEVFHLLLESALVTPFALLTGALESLGAVQDIFSAERAENERRKVVERTPSYNYGAQATLRERQSGDYARYLQIVDREMYVKVIERELFDALVDFLQERGVDVSELRDRQNTILNYGVMANSVQAQNVVAGGKVNADLRGGAA